MSDVQALVDALAASLARPVDVDDRQLRIIAYSSHDGEVDAVRRATLLQREAPQEVVDWLGSLGIQQAHDVVRVPAMPRFGMAPRVCVPIRFDGTLLGYLWLIDDPRPLTDAELAETQRAARDIGVALYRARRLEHEDRARERELLRALAGHRSGLDRAAASTELVRGGFLATAPAHAVLVLQAFDRHGHEAPDTVRVRLAAAAQQVRRTVAPHHQLVLVVGEQVIAVLACKDAEELERRGSALAAAAERGLADFPEWSALVAAGAERTTASELPAAHDEAQRALRVGSRVAGLGPLVRWSELGAYRTIAELIGDREPPQALPAALRRLLECNEAGVLVSTLERYLDSGGDARAAAEGLYIHRSSLYGRLHRIEEVTGIDLGSGEERLDLHLGLRLWRLGGGELPA